jgi:DNA polymerase-3 subunit epsilon
LRGADYIAAHNAGFDRKVLFTCFAAAGYTPPEIDALCTVKLSKAAWGIRPTKLPDVCQHFQIALDHHDALSDANACAEILVIAISQGFDLERGKLGKPSYQVRA